MSIQHVSADTDLDSILEIIDHEFKLSKIKIILTKCNPPITGFDGKVSIVRILENN